MRKEKLSKKKEIKMLKRCFRLDDEVDGLLDQDYNPLCSGEDEVKEV